jgi:hypothetical protein
MTLNRNPIIIQEIKLSTINYGWKLNQLVQQQSFSKIKIQNNCNINFLVKTVKIITKIIMRKKKMSIVHRIKTRICINAKYLWIISKNQTRIL